MYMIDVLKRLAELDAQNPNIIKEDQQVDECGMMPPMGGMDRPSTPASINMTAASGPELSGMLRDIMQLAGMSAKTEPAMTEPMSAPVMALEPAGSDDMGPPSPVDSMRSVLDKLNPDDEEGDDEISRPEGDVDGDGDHDMKDHDKEKVDEFDNEPDPKTTGYGSMTPTGDDLASKGGEAPKVNGGGNPMQKTMEQIERDLFAEYQSFMSES
jgi:hypothetical protein